MLEGPSLLNSALSQEFSSQRDGSSWLRKVRCGLSRKMVGTGSDGQTCREQWSQSLNSQQTTLSEKSKSLEELLLSSEVLWSVLQQVWFSCVWREDKQEAPQLEMQQKDDEVPSPRLPKKRNGNANRGTGDEFQRL